MTTLDLINHELLYPSYLRNGIQSGAALGTMDAADEAIAFIGRLQTSDGGSLTLSAAGGGSISFLTDAITFADASTNVRIGLQDVSTTAAQQPDGTFDVYNDVTGSGSPWSNYTWTTVSMSGGTGSKTLNNGDLFAVVFYMTARAGSDSVILRGGNSAPGSLPYVSNLSGGSWAKNYPLPTVVILDDDGTTLGKIDGALVSSDCGIAFNRSSASSPNEIGNLITMPFSGSVDALMIGQMYSTDANSGFDLRLYSDPLGTPSQLASISVDPDWLYTTTGADNLLIIPLSSPVALTQGSTYAVTQIATGSTQIYTGYHTFADAAYRALSPGGTNVSKTSRSGGSGAFAAGTTTQHIMMGMRFSSIELGGGVTAKTIASMLQPIGQGV